VSRTQAGKSFQSYAEIRQEGGDGWEATVLQFGPHLHTLHAYPHYTHGTPCHTAQHTVPLPLHCTHTRHPPPPAPHHSTCPHHTAGREGHSQLRLGCLDSVCLEWEDIPRSQIIWPGREEKEAMNNIFCVGGRGDWTVWIFSYGGDIENLQVVTLHVSNACEHLFGSVSICSGLPSIIQRQRRPPAQKAVETMGCGI